MVIHEDQEMPLEQSSRKSIGYNVTTKVSNINPIENEITRNIKHKSKKSKRKHSSECEDSPLEKLCCDGNSVNHICKSDIEELRSIYKKCKAIVTKIENKYGNLLGIDNLKDQTEIKDLENQKCTCVLNKKIVFDDNGKEVSQEPDLSTHICPKKLNIKHHSTENTVQIEYELKDTLPEDILSLSNLLRNPDLEITVRNKVISKIRGLKQEYLDEVRFNKQAIIEKVKSNPDEVIDFHGTNLSSLPGYIL